MHNTTTSPEERKQLKPSQKTIDFILNYSRALDARVLESEVEFTMVKN